MFKLDNLKKYLSKNFKYKNLSTYLKNCIILSELNSPQDYSIPFRIFGSLSFHCDPHLWIETLFLGELSRARDLRLVAKGYHAAAWALLLLY